MKFRNLVEEGGMQGNTTTPNGGNSGQGVGTDGFVGLMPRDASVGSLDEMDRELIGSEGLTATELDGEDEGRQETPSKTRKNIHVVEAGEVPARRVLEVDDDYDHDHDAATHDVNDDDGEAVAGEASLEEAEVTGL
jgi:hypothetical protein